jgi:hypothetical protein
MRNTFKDVKSGVINEFDLKKDNVLSSFVDDNWENFEEFHTLFDVPFESYKEFPTNAFD